MKRKAVHFSLTECDHQKKLRTADSDADLSDISNSEDDQEGRLEEEEDDDDETDVHSSLWQPKTRKVRANTHPYHVQPLGNTFLDPEASLKGQELRSSMGLFSLVGECLLVDLLGYFDVLPLMRLTETCKGLYVIGREEELMRKLCLRKFRSEFVFHGNWLRTLIECSRPGWLARHPRLLPIGKPSPIRIEHFYSDMLYQSWRCTSVDLATIHWSQRDNIERRCALSLQEFKERYERPNVPVIITDIVTRWKGFQEESWTHAALLRRFSSQRFKVGETEPTLENYLRYSDLVCEESPLYLFDNEYGEKQPLMLDDYFVADYFQEDFFSLLDADVRPSFRWILVGPPRSGSSFHKDPNYTSAWNGVFVGRKKWVLFPPNVTPPGVIPSADHADVTTPLSVIEWFLNYYSQIQRLPRHMRPVECVLKAGELLFIPHMWWHTALNLEESVAVTQNYVSRNNLQNVVDFLEKNGKFKMLNELERKMVQHSTELAQLWNEMQARRSEKKENMLQKSWAHCVEGAKDFSFAFNFEAEGEEDDKEK